MADFDGYLPMESGVIDLCEASLNGLVGNGVIVEPCLPQFDMGRLWQTWLVLRHWTRHGMRELYDDPDTRNLLKPEAIWEIEGAFGTSAKTVFDAGVARADWYDEVHRLLESYDFLVLPTAQVFPFDKTVHWPREISGVEMDTYHRWMEVVIGGTLAGIPICNVPVGFDEQGRPMGMQIMGRFGDDQKVLEFAMAYEAVTDHLQQRPAMRESS
jgi:amidase